MHRTCRKGLKSSGSKRSNQSRPKGNQKQSQVSEESPNIYFNDSALSDVNDSDRSEQDNSYKYPESHRFFTRSKAAPVNNNKSIICGIEFCEKRFMCTHSALDHAYSYHGYDQKAFVCHKCKKIFLSIGDKIDNHNQHCHLEGYEGLRNYVRRW